MNIRILILVVAIAFSGAGIASFLSEATHSHTANNQEYVGHSG